jgi:hypothetical protein
MKRRGFSCCSAFSWRALQCYSLGKTISRSSAKRHNAGPVICLLVPDKVISDYETGKSEPIVKTMAELEEMANE